MESNKQLAHLLQRLHDAGVPEDVGANVIYNPVVQIAFNQVLNELEIMKQQHDETCKDLYHAALGVEKHIASPKEEPPMQSP